MKLSMPQEHSWILVSVVAGSGFITLLASLVLSDLKRLDYEGSHAVGNAAFRLETTIYDNQARKFREDSLQYAAYQAGWNACVERLVPEFRGRKP